MMSFTCLTFLDTNQLYIEVLAKVSRKSLLLSYPRRSTTRRAGIQKSLILKNTGFLIKTLGMTNKDFCKSLL